MSGNTLKLALGTKLKLVPQATFKSMGDDEGGVLLRLDTGEMFTLNDTASAFVEALDGKHTLSQVRDILLDQFEVESDELEADLNEMAADMLSQGLIEGA